MIRNNYGYSLIIKNSLGLTVAEIFENDIEFSISRTSNKHEVGEAEFVVYNLAQDTRERMHVGVDVEVLQIKEQDLNKLYFSVWDSDKHSIFFIGDIVCCYSRRRDVDIATYIMAQAGIKLCNYRQQWSFSVGTTFFEMANRFAKFAGVGVDEISVSRIPLVIPQKWKSDKTPIDCLKELSPDGEYAVFVDLDMLYAIGQNDSIFQYPHIEINETNLLSLVPKGKFLECDILLENNIKLGQPITVKSTIDVVKNGTYKVVNINSSGTIGLHNPSNVEMTIELYKLSGLLNTITNLIQGIE